MEDAVYQEWCEDWQVFGKNVSICYFINFFHKYLLGSNYVSGMVLGAKDTMKDTLPIC